MQPLLFQMSKALSATTAKPRARNPPAARLDRPLSEAYFRAVFGHSKRGPREAQEGPCASCLL